MMAKAVFPGKYIQGAGALAELPDYLDIFGKKALILASPSARKSMLPRHADILKKKSVSFENFSGECCENEIRRLQDIVAVGKIDIVVGMGGGKAIDTAKIVADRCNLPVVVVPTIASTDAPCSACAVVYSDEGVFSHTCYQKMNPQIVLVDTEIIANAPVRYLLAGMGDALSTWFEARSCNRTKSRNECGGISTMAGLHLSKLCFESLLDYGVPAKIACEMRVVTPALERIVESNILLSGLGFESAGLAAAHAIHNGLTALEDTHAFLHGEKVAFGLLASLLLTDAPISECELVFDFCRRIGLPTTLAQIGLKNASRSDLMKAAEKSCEPGSFIHHEAGEMSPERVVAAMTAADAIGIKGNINISVIPQRPSALKSPTKTV